MPFTIEFQPIGIRLNFDKPIIALDAARQAGIELIAICGGEGTCGKCLIQLLTDLNEFPPCSTDRKFISKSKLDIGYRLACQLTIDRDIKIRIPDESALEGQILQIDGEDILENNDPIVNKSSLTLAQATIQDLSSDFSRIKDVINNDDLKAELPILRKIPTILRKHNWDIETDRRKQLYRLL